MKRNFKKFPLQFVAVCSLTLAMSLGAASALSDSLFAPSEVQAAAVSPFTDDIPDWSADAVKEMSDAGILKGYEDGTFKADKTMSKMEFIKAAVCSVRSEAEIDAIIADGKKGYAQADGSTFNTYEYFCSEFDKQAVRTGTKKASEFWGTRYLFAAYQLHNMDGINYITTSPTTPGYSEPISRQKACQIMYLTCTRVKNENLPIAKGIRNIMNVPEGISVTYDDAVEACVSNGLIAGIDSNYTIAPTKTLTRAEASAIAARIINPSRRVDKPVVPADKQVVKGQTSQSGNSVTRKNPVTGETKTMTVSEWRDFLNSNEPTYQGTSDGERSKDGWYTWDSAWNDWTPITAQ